jgi:AraC-like DNA-binding protein
MTRRVRNPGQLLLVESGISYLRTQQGAWVIPAHNIAWLPASLWQIPRSDSGRCRVIPLPSELCDWPETVRVLRVSSLLTVCLERLNRLSPGDARMRRLLWDVVATEIAQARPVPLVPVPTMPCMLKAVRGVLEAPNAAAGLDTLAARAGMSRRSFARHFRLQTGLSYSQWKRAVVARHALELVAAGHKVSSVAVDVGYESVSAFIAMFRRQYGRSPGAYVTNPNSRAGLSTRTRRRAASSGAHSSSRFNSVPVSLPPSGI